MERTQIESFIKDKAKELGFCLCGISGDIPPQSHDFYEWWLNQGFSAEMSYLERHREKRKSIGNILPHAKSVIACALPFPGNAPPILVGEQTGKVARYAAGRDYHLVLEEKLRELALYLDEMTKPEQASVVAVDYKPISDRAMAAGAGLGWIGKNSMLINTEWGSWFWLGEIVTQAPLTPDKPSPDRCGNCRRCIEACPTQAILPDIRAVDSNKCISYWTIEKKGAMSEEIKPKLSGWLVGCDICQEVCPWNAHSLKAGRQELGPVHEEEIKIAEVLAMEQKEFDLRYKDRALSRPKLAGLKRNGEALSRD